MNLDKKYIGEKLKEYRKKAKMTQEMVSNKIEIDEKHYGKLERGLFTPSLESFFKLINVLNIPLEEFEVLKGKENGLKARLTRKINLADEKELVAFEEILGAIEKMKD